jgi:hypothetical protein
MYQLNEADGQAVDAFFAMRSLSAADGESGADQDVLRQRVECVDELLKALEALPAYDPPADLAQRTLGAARRRERRASLLGPMDGDGGPAIQPIL